jgi:NAD+ kinase
MKAVMNTLPPHPRIGCVADSLPRSQQAYAMLVATYPELATAYTPDNPPAILLVLGGDGFMLHTMHDYMHTQTSFYGLNTGTVGFLLNTMPEEPFDLYARLAQAVPAHMHPLAMQATDIDGKQHTALAINEVSLFRQSHQAAHIAVAVNDELRLEQLIGDGILIATPGGSSAYNHAAGGPILPLRSHVLALTPICPFRPRRWRGALLNNTDTLTFTILQPQQRPVSAVADFHEIAAVEQVSVREDSSITLTLLFDPGMALADRILKEQFMY